MKKLKVINLSKYFLVAFGIILVAVLGSAFVYLGMDYYVLVTKPTMWVPNIVFPIMWTIIYFIVGVVSFLAIKNKTINKNTTILLVLNGIFNVLWCLLFFTINQPLAGLVFIVINLVLAYALFINFLNINKYYGLALIIYPLWISVATTLNVAIWILN